MHEMDNLLNSHCIVRGVSVRNETTLKRVNEVFQMRSSSFNQNIGNNFEKDIAKFGGFKILQDLSFFNFRKNNAIWLGQGDEQCHKKCTWLG